MMAIVEEEGEFVKIKPSRMVSWIVLKYFKTRFEREKMEIIKEHFNSKEYLKSVVDGMSSSDDVAKVLQNTLEKFGTGKRSKRKAGQIT